MRILHHFDRRLLDPGEADVKRTVRKAARQSRPERVEPCIQIRLDDDNHLWKQIQANTEGTWIGRAIPPRDIEGPVRVAVAWWTDHLGRRHVRVQGWNPDGMIEGRGYFRDAWDAVWLGPLWHLYPNRTYHMFREGRSEPIVCCACGAAGRPPEVAWMGEHCGACNDRCEEGEPALAPHFEPRRTLFGGDLGRFGGGAFSPGGELLALAGDRLQLVDSRSGEIRHEIPNDCLRPVFSPTGQTLVIDDRPAVDLWDVRTGKRRERLRHRDGDPFNFALSADGKLLAVQNYRLTLWDFTAEPKRIDVDEVMHPGPMAFVGKLLGTTGRSPRLFDLREPTTGAVRVTLEGHQQAITAVAVSPDGKSLATGGQDGDIWLWDLRTYNRQGHLCDPAGQIESLAFSPDGRVLASATNEQGIRFWDMNTLEERAAFRWGNRGVYQIAFAPDGQWLLAAGGNVVKLIPWRALLDAVAE